MSDPMRARALEAGMYALALLEGRTPPMPTPQRVDEWLRRIREAEAERAAAKRVHEAAHRSP